MNKTWEDKIYFAYKIKTNKLSYKIKFNFLFFFSESVNNIL